ncbi:hypothetical protein NUH16_003099 [Penicillium rubens]|nr:hypothetical protein NUH16_003099 [Penicillium rubens]
MDAPNGSPDQKNEGDQQPIELPILSEKDKSQETSDHAPSVSETIQLQTLLLTIAALSFATGSRYKNTLATEPFQPILKVLADLERDDPKFTFPAAPLVGLYRSL